MKKIKKILTWENCENEHYVGDENCSGCAGCPDDCECGGLIHIDESDDGTEVIFKCDKCKKEFT